MSPKSGKNFPKLGKGKKLSFSNALGDVEEARELIRSSFPLSKHGKQIAAWWAAYRDLGLSSVSRAGEIWKGRARRIDAHEMDALRNAAITQLEERLRERDQLKDRIAALKARASNARTIQAG